MKSFGQTRPTDCMLVSAVPAAPLQLLRLRPTNSSPRLRPPISPLRPIFVFSIFCFRPTPTPVLQFTNLASDYGNLAYDRPYDITNFVFDYGDLHRDGHGSSLFNEDVGIFFSVGAYVAAGLL